MASPSDDRRWLSSHSFSAGFPNPGMKEEWDVVYERRRNVEYIQERNARAQSSKDIWALREHSLMRQKEMEQKEPSSSDTDERPQSADDSNHNWASRPDPTRLAHIPVADDATLIDGTFLGKSTGTCSYKPIGVPVGGRPILRAQKNIGRHTIVSPHRSRSKVRKCPAIDTDSIPSAAAGGSPPGDATATTTLEYPVISPIKLAKGSPDRSVPKKTTSLLTLTSGKKERRKKGRTKRAEFVSSMEGSVEALRHDGGEMFDI